MELIINSLPVTEENYSETMKTKVEPYLDRYRREGFFEGWDKNKLHYEKYLIENASKNVVIVHGFTESTVKFREMIYVYMLMGFNVFIYDQRGHGKSFRYAEKTETVSVCKFDEYIKDLDLFINNVVKPDGAGLPLLLYGHSMGGAVSIQYLQEHPDVFEKAVLTAPMVLCKCHGLEPWFALFLARFFCLIGQRHKETVGSKDFNPNREYTSSNNTSKARFDYINANKAAERCLQTCNASYGWLKEAILVSRKNLDPERCKKITLPVLLCQAEDDGSVYNDKEEEFVKFVKNIRLERFPGSRHEIFGSVDGTMLPYLQTIEKFYKS